MRTENIDVKLTMSIPYNKPDKNGNIYTKEAVEKSVINLHKNLPIIFRDESGENVIGTTTGNSHICILDSENQLCKITVDGKIFYGGTECIVNKMTDGKIDDFEIVGIGITK